MPLAARHWFQRVRNLDPNTLHNASQSPRLVRMQVSGKSNQYTLVVANSTPEIDEDSIAWAQPHLNPLLIIERSSFDLERLGGTIREQCSSNAARRKNS